MSLMQQMLVPRGQNEGDMERELKNVIDYAVRIYGLTYVLDRGPSFIASLLGGDGSSSGGILGSVAPLAVSISPIGKILGKML